MCRNCQNLSFPFFNLKFLILAAQFFLAPSSECLISKENNSILLLFFNKKNDGIPPNYPIGIEDLFLLIYFLLDVYKGESSHFFFSFLNLK